MKSAENNVSLTAVPVGTKWSRDKMHLYQPDFRRHPPDFSIKDKVTLAVKLCTDLEIK
jgi:hypothetical protein